MKGRLEHSSLTQPEVAVDEWKSVPQQHTSCFHASSPDIVFVVLLQDIFDVIGICHQQIALIQPLELGNTTILSRGSSEQPQHVPDHFRHHTQNRSSAWARYRSLRCVGYRCHEFEGLILLEIVSKCRLDSVNFPFGQFQPRTLAPGVICYELLSNSMLTRFKKHAGVSRIYTNFSFQAQTFMSSCPLW